MDEGRLPEKYSLPVFFNIAFIYFQRDRIDVIYIIKIIILIINSFQKVFIRTILTSNFSRLWCGIWKCWSDFLLMVLKVLISYANAARFISLNGILIKDSGFFRFIFRFCRLPNRLHLSVIYHFDILPSWLILTIVTTETLKKQFPCSQQQLVPLGAPNRTLIASKN